MGRAGFFDLSLDGSWGGVISGDKVSATWAPCACGNRSPSVGRIFNAFRIWRVATRLPVPALSTPMSEVCLDAFTSEAVACAIRRPPPSS